MGNLPDFEGCDHCGWNVQSFVFAEMPSGLPLSYCGSCGTRFWVELNRQAALVVDMRHLIEK